MSIDIAGNVVRLMDSGHGARSDIYARPLREATLSFSTARASDDEINKLLANAQVDHLTDSEGSNWLVGTWSNNYGDNDPSMVWNVKLVESAKNEISSVDILGFTCSVEWSEVQQSEDFNQEPSVISIEADLEEAEHRLISDAQRKQVDSRSPEYLQVTLRGDSEVSVSVRFGQIVWQQAGQAFRNHIVLVTQQGDSAETLQGGILGKVNQPRLQRTTNIAARTERILDALLGRLQSAGVLSKDDIVHIQSKARSEFSNAQWDELRMVDNVADHR